MAEGRLVELAGTVLRSLRVRFLWDQARDRWLFARAVLKEGACKVDTSGAGLV